MSYPDARYPGDEGDVSPAYRPADQESELTIGSSTAIRYRPSAHQTAKEEHLSWTP